MGEKGKKILIIDDDPDFVRTTGIVLKSAGYEVFEALSGKEGLEKSKSDKPDLYIIDLMMETYSEGSNIVRILSENTETKDKPRIMITSVDLKGPWQAYPQDEWLACDVLLQKPVSPDDLLKCVRDALTGT
ncbi:MAG: response regulator [Deltaproteobacteria bacterium]|nr:MAG: response regulator [Deltaproteobacteria bacterium]